MTTASPIPASLATACAAHDRHRLDVLDALLDEAAPSAVRELLGAALDMCATLRTERDALAAGLGEARAELADTARDLEQFTAESEAIVQIVGAGPDDNLPVAVRSVVAHLAACQTRIAGLEQAADERSKEVARLTARVAELEARPVLTEGSLHAAINTGYGSWNASLGIASWPGTIEISRRVFAVLGPVTLPPAQDRATAERLLVAMGEFPTRVNAATWQAMIDKTVTALASLGAPPTPEVFAGVSEEELHSVFARAYGECPDGISYAVAAGLRAVLARLEVSLVAPVDPEAVTATILAAVGGSSEAPAKEWKAATKACRTTLTAAGIPVTPERGQ